VVKPPAHERERSERSRGNESASRVTLFEDESVVMTARPSLISTLPKLIVTLGLYELWRRRNTTILTNRRILFGAGIFQRTEQSIPLSNVNDVVFIRRGVNCYAQVAGTHRGRNSMKEIGPLSASVCRRFVGELLKRT